MSYLLYGVHELCPTSVLPKGWILHLAEVGSGPEPHPGLTIPDDGRTPIVRIQHSWGIGGRCLPLPAEVGNWSRRVASMVRNTPNCHIWIPGNEPNLNVEGGFLPSHVTDCYRLARGAIHLLPGHENDQVLLPPLGPWNADTGIGWISYMQLMTSFLDDVDGFAFHTYARGSTPDQITSESKMGAPYEQFYSGFRTYRDWMATIPPRFRDRPVYITEFDENDAWVDQNTGIVQAAYKEIDDWNRTPGNQQIRALILYRWPKYDKYNIEGKQGVIDDFLAAQKHGYMWKEETKETPMTSLINPSLEAPYVVVPGKDNCFVANGWTAWMRENQPPGVDVGEAGICIWPEYKESKKALDPRRVIDGNSAQCLFVTSNRLNAGIYQRVAVGTGATCEFSTHVQTWESNSDDPGAADGEMYARIGIDPRGGVNPEALGIVWQQWFRARADYAQIGIGAVAEANAITCFIQFWNKWKMKHNDAYIDKCALTVTGGTPTPEPTPGPGPIFEDAAALYAYAVTLRTIADGLDDVASRIDGSAIPSAARAKLEQARGLLGEVLG